jgi:PD-(D/E)XK nuclease superfamily
MESVSVPTGRDPRDAATPHLSVSQANLIARCPLQWSFKYQDALPAPAIDSDNWRLGVWLDDALSAFYRGEGWAFSMDTLPERLHGRAETAVAQWADSPYAAVRAAEGGVQRRHEHTIHPRGTYGEGLAVIGYSDLITDDGRLIDWKYGGKPNDAEWVQNVSRQLRFYAYAEPFLYIERAYIVRFGGKELTVIEVPLSADGGADMIDWLYSAADRGPIAAVHAPTPGAHCGYCPYTAECAAACKVAFDG